MTVVPSEHFDKTNFSTHACSLTCSEIPHVKEPVCRSWEKWDEPQVNASVSPSQLSVSSA